MSDEFKNGTCAPSDCASCGLDCGNTSPESHNTITLTLDDDTEIECAILTVFPVEKQEYIALLPLDENGQNQSGEVYLDQILSDVMDIPLHGTDDRSALPGAPLSQIGSQTSEAGI